MTETAGHLLVIGDRAPLVWVLTEQRMAFPSHRTREAGALQAGDLLLIYTTRGCFHNPTRDRGRVIGEAVVASVVERLTEPVTFGAHAYPVGCEVFIRALAPYPHGVALADLVAAMEVFPDPATWSARMRRALVPLSSRDVKLLRAQLAPLLTEPAAALRSYLAAAPPAT